MHILTLFRDLVDDLCQFLTPLAIPDSFVELYDQISRSTRIEGDNSKLDKILGRFEVEKWLGTADPLLSQRYDVITRSEEEEGEGEEQDQCLFFPFSLFFVGSTPIIVLHSFSLSFSFSFSFFLFPSFSHSLSLLEFRTELLPSISFRTSDFLISIVSVLAHLCAHTFSFSLPLPTSLSN